ncbi:MAG TPA: dienelactone hydrolase family protein [Candidatus Binataceae bacterium]|jgi:carboxymethylenebutenolidase|nr:dienelactone hydrolase family protein [Candidatus Binataceae bacterium]
MALAGQVEDPQRIVTEEVKFASDGTNIEAFLARPRQAGSYPGVIVIHEAFGVDDHIKDVVGRFANAGFIALAPNLYQRVGAPTPGDMSTVMQKMFGLQDPQIVRDLEAAAAHIRGLQGANGKVGCVGFCMGGRTTLLFACSSNKVDAAVDCWGGFIMSATPDAASTPSRPTPVIDLVGGLKCPLYVVIGAEDANPSPAHGADLRARLDKAGKSAHTTVEVFENAGHAFLNDKRPNYREKAAFELWPKVVAFFKRHLG